MSRLSTLAVVGAVIMLGACSAATTPSAPTSSGAPTPTRLATSAAPTPTPVAATASGPAFVVSAKRADGSYMAIPVALDGTAGTPISLGSVGESYAFRDDERGLWVFQSASQECVDICYGTMSVIDPRTGESTVLANNVPEPAHVQVVKGVVYMTYQAPYRTVTQRLDGKPLPWAYSGNTDYAAFSPDGSLVWRAVGPPEEHWQHSLFAAGTAPTAVDAINGVSDDFRGWVGNTTVLLARWDPASQTDSYFLFDTRSLTSAPLSMPAGAQYVTIEPGGILHFKKYTPDPTWRDIFTTVAGDVVGSGPQGSAAGTLSPSGNLIELSIDTTANPDTYAQRINGMAVVDVATGVATPVSGLPTDAMWLTNSPVAAKSS